MTFIVNGIKEGVDKKYNIEFLLGVDSTLLAKKFLESTGIIVLSLKEYREQQGLGPATEAGKPGKEKFGNIRFTINYQQQDITLYANFDGNLNQACEFFLMAGFPIDSINFVDNPVTEEEAKKIVEDSKRANEKRIEQEKQSIEKKQEAERKIFEDPRLAGDKKVIERIFAKNENVVELTRGFASGKDLKKLKEKEEELKKLKLGTNHERIVELVEEMIAMLENMENDYYNATANQEKKIFEDSVVTDVDVTKELNKVAKVQQLQSVGGKIKNTEQEYQIFGKYIIFVKMLYKDLLYLIQTPRHLTNMLYNTYDLVELAIIFILIQINGYTLANTIFLFSENTNYEYFYILDIKIGLIGLLIYGARHLRKKNLWMLGALIPAILLLYYIFINIINNNFSI